MKYLIASDIHGSFLYAEKLIEAFIKEKADTMILLGDIYYHGPRNPFPEEYNPMKVSKILGKVKDKLIVVRGNCDSEVDEMISPFKFLKEYSLQIGDKIILFTHGHKVNPVNLPKEKCNAVFYGHLHKNGIAVSGGIKFINCGSVSLPKESERSYAVLEDSIATIKTLDGKEIDKTKI